MWIFLTCDTKKTRQKNLQKRKKKIWVTIFFSKFNIKRQKNEIVYNFKAIKTQFRKLYATPNPENRKRFFT